jgi:hypothetical protein
MLIRIGGIEEIDSGVDTAINHGVSCQLVGLPAEGHRAETEARYSKISMPKFTVVHVSNLP